MSVYAVRESGESLRFLRSDIAVVVAVVGSEERGRELDAGSTRDETRNRTRTRVTGAPSGCVVERAQAATASEQPACPSTNRLRNGREGFR